MRAPLPLRRDNRGATLAEFALVLPLALIFLLGLVDAGRYLYNVNQAQKAVQIGARWAVATDILASDLVDYSYVISGGVTQGDTVPEADFPGAECSSSSGTLSCACPSGGTCDYDLSVVNQASFDAMVARMQQIYGAIDPDDVHVNYIYSGLGYAGDPTGPDVAPFVTVSLEGMQFRPASGILFNAILNLPNFSQTLTMEDGRGSGSN